MTLERIDKYLENRINNWYHNSLIDYGINGKFVRAEAKGDSLRIIWEEEGKRYAMPVSWWPEYTAEQVYNIWMEMGGGEDTEEITAA